MSTFFFQEFINIMDFLAIFLSGSCLVSAAIYCIFFRVIYLPIFDRQNKINLNVNGPSYLKRGRLGRLSQISMLKPGTRLHAILCDRYKDDPFFNQYVKISHEKLKLFRIPFILSTISLLSMIFAGISILVLKIMAS